MFHISGIIVDESGRDYSENLANAYDLKIERIMNTGFPIRECRVKLNLPDRLNALCFTNAASTCLVNT